MIIIFIVERGGHEHVPKVVNVINFVSLFVSIFTRMECHGHESVSI